MSRVPCLILIAEYYQFSVVVIRFFQNFEVGGLGTFPKKKAFVLVKFTFKNETFQIFQKKFKFFVTKWQKIVKKTLVVICCSNPIQCEEGFSLLGIDIVPSYTFPFNNLSLDLVCPWRMNWQSNKGRLDSHSNKYLSFTYWQVQVL